MSVYPGAALIHARWLIIQSSKWCQVKHIILARYMIHIAMV